MNILELGDHIESLKSEYQIPYGGIINASRGFFVDAKSYEDARHHLYAFINKIGDVKHYYESIHISFPTHEKKIIDAAFAYLDLEIELFLASFDIEAEKKGLIQLDPLKRQLLNDRVSKIETKMYGPKISDRHGEVVIMKDHLTQRLVNHRDRVTEDEYSFFVDKLGLQTNGYTSKAEEYQEQRENLIPSDKVKECIKLLCSFYAEEGIDIDQWEVGIEEGRQTFFVDRKKRKMYVPSTGLSLKRLLGVAFQHETEQHSLQGENGRIQAGGVSVGSYITGEEGIAMTLQKTLDKDLNQIKADPEGSPVLTYMGEMYIGEELKNLIRIYYKLDPHISNEQLEKKVQSRYERIKRFHSHKVVGSGRKDVSYFRGLLQVLNLIKKNGITEDKLPKVFAGKLPLELKLSDDFVLSDENKVVYPHFIGRYIYRKLKGMNQTDGYLESQGLSSKLNTKKVPMDQKRKLVEILKILKPYT